MSSSEAPRRTFLAWYRRYYLLVNLPILFLLTELVLVKVDLVHQPPFDEKNDLAKGLAAYDARPPAPGQPVMLLLGNSATDRGFDPVKIEQTLGGTTRVYNFGLKGARLDDQYGLIEHLASRGIQPAAVMLGVNAYLIDHMVNPDTLYPWLERRTPYIYFHRSRIRTKAWRWVQRVLGIERKDKYKKLDKDPDADLMATRLPPNAIELFVTQFAHRPVDDFPMIDELPAFVEWLTRRGIRPYVVVLPMAPGGTRAIDTFEPLITAIRAKVPGDALDLSRAAAEFPDDFFYDVGHPNADGRAAFTRALGAWLASRKDLPR